MLNQYRVGARHDVVQHDEKARLRVKARNDKGNEIAGQARNDVRMVCGVGKVPASEGFRVGYFIFEKFRQQPT